jgi:NAD+ kinase
MQRFTLGSDPRTASVGVIVAPTTNCAPQIRMLEAWADAQGVELLDLGTSAEPNGFRAGCGLIIALGGDGTILRALQLAMAHRVGVLGINFGTVGFLADRQRDELEPALACIAAGEAMLDERTALVAKLGSEPQSTVVAFNDVVVARRPGFGTARLRVDVGDETILTLRGDGIVIASPTGSTAYNTGAGGPAVAPTLDAIVVTPLATQGSPLRSLVLDGRDTVSIAALPASAPLRAEIDGRTVFDVPDGAVEICAAPHKARLVRTRPRTFHHDLVRGL